MPSPTSGRPALPTAAGSPHTSSAATLTGIITVVMTLVGWSSVPLFITHFAADLDVWTSNGWRYGFSALLWAPVLIYHASRRSLPPTLFRAAIIPALFNALGQVVFAWSFYKTDPTTATFGLRMQIVFVAIGAYMLFPAERELLRRPLTWLAIALVLVGVCGTIFLAPGARSAASSAPPADHLLGVAMAIGGGLLFAGYGLSVRRCMHGFHPVTAFAAISQYTAAIMVALMLIFGHDVHTGAWNGGLSAWLLPAGPFALLLLSSVIGIALGHVFYYIAIARLGVAVSSGVIQLQPFLVAIGSYFILSKPVTTGQMVTGVIAVGGAVLLLTMQWLVSRQLRRDTATPSLLREAPPDAAEAVTESSAYCLDDNATPTGSASVSTSAASAPNRAAAKQP